MSTVISNETNYQKKVTSSPNYQLLKVSPHSGGDTVNLTTSGGNETVFEIPSNVLNFARSKISFNLNIPGQRTDDGAGGYDLHYGAVFLGGSVPAMRDLDLYTHNGVRLCTIPNCNKYLQVVRKTDTKLEDFLCQQDTGLERTNITGDENYNYRFPVAAGNDPAFTEARISHNEYEPAYTSVTDYYDSAGDNTAIVAEFRFNLSEIKNTILELDKDIWFRGEVVYLRITWAPISQIGAAGDDSTLVNQTQLTANQAAPNNVITISNLNLYLAIEKNRTLEMQVKEQVMEHGLNILVDYVHAYNISLTGGTQTISQRFTRGSHGRNLKKVYSIPYIASSTTLSNYFNHHYDQDGEAIESLYTRLNNERLQQWNMVSADGDEYMVMSDILKGSVIQSRGQFESYYFFVDVFDNLKLFERSPNVVNGLSLDTEQKYEVVASTEGSRNWYSFAVCQRMLSINKDEIVLD